MKREDVTQKELKEKKSSIHEINRGKEGAQGKKVNIKSVTQGQIRRNWE